MSVVVVILVCVKKSLVLDLGQGPKAWAPSNLFPVSADFDIWNIRWAGNRMPVPNTSNLTIGEFYAVHSSNENGAIYVETVPAGWKQLSAATKRKVLIWCKL
ncbi:hypothetical protein K438DRAFT_1749587 [Mycena galopus ATCC 62051]|nr:hypothetical protein K438DRAFT_1749587 [Mycena galopus ATCC 62051]